MTTLPHHLDEGDRRRVHLLVVDDEPSFSDALAIAFGREGFRVSVAADGMAALAIFEADPPDLILLDVMLPRLSGIDVCRTIRAVSSVPIIMVTARSEEVDAVVGLEVGADDYVAKPYRLRELVARVRANLRRNESGPGNGGRSSPSLTTDEVISVHGVSIDYARHEVTVDGQLVELTLKEFDVLALLLSNAGRVVTRDTLIDRVWGSDYVGDTKTLDVHVKRLRAKIDRASGQRPRITTVRGLGYKYEDPGS
jgi:two-component system, OmpR family, response regulator RegX3